MQRIYIVTGAYGHLGSTIVRELCARGERVRGLVFAGERPAEPQGIKIEEFEGDIRDVKTLEPLFAGIEGYEVVVIHAAAVVDIRSKVSPLAYEVNVEGTKNLAEVALRHNIWRFIHISSVHALPESKNGALVREIKDYSADNVVGGYAKTKAEASAFIIQAAQERGLPAMILHPSGIVGPYDAGRNNAVRGIINFLNGRIPGCPKGGYDFVDVRDVAAACLSAIENGRVGEPYIISNRNYEMNELFAVSGSITGLRRSRAPIPIWMAKAAAPILERAAIRKQKAPLVTGYSLHTLESNDRFSHEKASKELGYWPRDMFDTLRDTAVWLAENGLIQAFKQPRALKVKVAKKQRI